jgi:hypothetical protein
MFFDVYTEAGITNMRPEGNIADSERYDRRGAAMIHTAGGADLRPGHMGRDHHMAREERRIATAFVSDKCAASCPSSPAAR